MTYLPPLPAIGNVHIELFGPPSEEDVWDTARWDEAVWSGLDWQDVTPQSMNAQITWGTDDNMGALSVCSAGSWQITTYDPGRLLDPANWDSRFYQLLKPGGLVRIIYNDGANPVEVIRVGFIDEISYAISTKTGAIRATDGISLMVKAKVPGGQAHLPATPLTLRAFARYILAQAKVQYIEVEDDPAGEDDPSIGLPIDSEASAWQHISAAALDCLHGVWLDRHGVLRFRYFGTPRVTYINVGSGLGGQEGIPLDELNTKLSMEGVFNHAWAKYQSFDDSFSEAKKQQSIDVYGDLLIRRERPIPNSGEWVDQIMQDRGAASTQYELGTLRPRTPEELAQILSLGMVDEIGIQVFDHGPIIGRLATVLGGSVEANTESGWSAELTTYEKADAWWDKTADRLHLVRIDALKTIECTATWTGSGTTYTGDSTEAEHQVWDTTPSGADGVVTSINMNILLEQIDFGAFASVWDAKLRLFLPEHEDPLGQGERLEHSRWLRSDMGANWDDATPCGLLGGVSGGTVYTELGGGGGGRWIEFDFRGPVEKWRTGTPQKGVQISSWPFDPPDGPQHQLIAGFNHKYPPYLLLAVKK